MPSQSQAPGAARTISTSHSLLFGSLGGAIDVAMLNPPAFQIPLYWQLYIRELETLR